MKRRKDRTYNKPGNIPRLDSILRSFINENSEYKKISEIMLLIKAWKETVGEEFSKFTKIVNYRNGILFVKVTHSVWRNEFYHIESEITQKLRAKAKGVKITKIVFV